MTEWELCPGMKWQTFKYENGIMEYIVQTIYDTVKRMAGSWDLKHKGLGLSLSYDIVKAHGGILSIKSKEGEGAVYCSTFYYLRFC